MKELVEFHPEWTDAQDVSALLKAGAIYGPNQKEEFLRAIPLRDLENLLGKAAITSAEFEVVPDSEQRWPALLHWVVMLNVNFTDGGQATYRLYFEPFKGALTQMDAVPPPVK